MPIQPLSTQNIDLNDSVVISEDRTQEDYHKDEASLHFITWLKLSCIEMAAKQLKITCISN